MLALHITPTPKVNYQGPKRVKNSPDGVELKKKIKGFTAKPKKIDSVSRPRDFFNLIQTSKIGQWTSKGQKRPQMGLK